MSILTTYPTREEWLQTCYVRSKSEGSQRVAFYALKHFDDFLKERHKEISEQQILAQLREKARTPEPYIFLNGFVQFMANNKMHVRAMQPYFSYIKSYLRSQGIPIYNEDVKQFVKFPKLVKERRQPITREIIKKLLSKVYPKTNALLLTLVSSGLRLSTALQLQAGDFDSRQKPVRVRVRGEITKGKEEYETFVSQEAYEAVKPFLENKQPADYIFIDDAKFTQVVTRRWERLFDALRKRTELEVKYRNSNRHHYGYHSLRAYFYTICTPIVSGEVAHAWMGHGEYLETYMRQTAEQRAEHYTRVEPYLTIENDMALKKKYDDLQKKVENVSVLEQKVARLEAMIERRNNAK